MQVITVRKVVLRPDLQPIEAIRLKDGTKGASVRSMCLLLDVARQGQVQRIKRTPDLVAALRQVSLPTSAGPRVFDVLLTHAISLWLMTFAAGRLTPHKQELVTFMKAHAVEAIERAFSDQDDSAVMEELSPAIDAWEQVQAGFVAIAAGIGQLQGAFTTIAQDQQAMKARLAALEGTSQAGDMACLLPDHVAHLYVLARAIRAKTGLPIADTLALLARQFGVSEATDIPAVRWPDVLLALELHLKSEGA